MSDPRIHLAGDPAPPGDTPLHADLDRPLTGDPLKATGPGGRKAAAPTRDEPRPTSPEQGRGGYGDANLLPASEVHLMDYVRVLYKRRWIAITAFLVVVVSVVVYTFTQTPIYAAKVQLMIEPENQNVVSFKEVLEQDKSTTDYYQTQYKILQSRKLARLTIESLGLWNHTEFAGKDAGGVGSGILSSVGPGKVSDPKMVADETPAQTRVIDSFLGHLSISPIRNSRLVDVKFESPDAPLSARVANSLATAYIAQNLEYKLGSSKDAADWLEEQMKQQRKVVEQSETALQTYKEKNEALSLEEKQNIVVQKLGELNAAVTKASTERIQKEELYNQIRKIQNDREALDTFPAIATNTFIQQLKGHLADLQRQQASLGETYGEKHPEIIKVRSAIEQTDAKLKAEIGKVVLSLKIDYEAASSQEKRLTAALNTQQAEAMKLSSKGIPYGALSRDATINRQLLDNLMQRQKETGVSAQLETNNIRVVDKAEVPLRPVRPKKTLNLLLAIFGGGLFACGLAFFFEYIDNRVKSPEEIKNYLGLPFLGLIPKLAEKETDSPLLHTGVPTAFAEAFRNLRTNILFSSTEVGGRSIVVTSTGPGEGKTLIACNLAIALAQAGQRVLLVDGDMRKPKVHAMFNESQAPGLSNVLVGNAKASEAVRKTPVQNLWLLLAGVAPPNPAELLGSQRFKTFLESLQEHFDWVIVDSPPVMAVTDAAVIAHAASGVAFVVGCEQTSKHTATAALEQLESARAHFFGGILNNVDVERHAYYYSHYYRRDYGQYYNTKES